MANAIRIDNHPPNDLASAAWSLNINTKLKLALSVRSVTKGMNNYFYEDISMPNINFKDSSNGRESIHAMNDDTNLKTV